MRSWHDKIAQEKKPCFPQCGDGVFVIVQITLPFMDEGTEAHAIPFVKTPEKRFMVSGVEVTRPTPNHGVHAFTQHLCIPGLLPSRKQAELVLERGNSFCRRFLSDGRDARASVARVVSPAAEHVAEKRKSLRDMRDVRFLLIDPEAKFSELVDDFSHHVLGAPFGTGQDDEVVGIAHHSFFSLRFHVFVHRVQHHIGKEG